MDYKKVLKELKKELYNGMICFEDECLEVSVRKHLRKKMQGK